ncbi:PMT-domain-containing protein [Hesseltinella vesiculosa]|uniref:Dolichyl-phosphate-mannose--protein mannosyltransferase n=1 Tax=Hesseltinella vesiculosa TaxID=101127 RepID=A0A1X2G6S0_9FUNG|nr:PMT-domain-containing protein [Hesseltinella vesiculosa]
MNSPTFQHNILIDEDQCRDKKPKQLSRRILSLAQSWNYILVPVVLTLASMITRFYDLARSDKVVWDEAHFGKFAAYYIENTFFMDVHPPLGKMLVAVGGWFAGFNGEFKFDAGQPFPEDVDYWTMRVFNTVFGVALVPLAYLTARKFSFSKTASLLAAVLTLCDTALLCITRFILLDSILLCFTALSMFCLAGFHHEQANPFSLSWWSYLFFTGVSLGCVSSVKWIGLFTTATVGVYTIEDLWRKYDLKEISRKAYALHWFARAVCLMVVPAIVYMITFKFHFDILTHSGPNDASMSPEFQAQLIGNARAGTPRELVYGSNLTLSSYARGTVLLHSHPSFYPEGSKQQQVTGYPHEDSNNNWRLMKPHDLDYVNKRTNGEITENDTVPEDDPNPDVLRHGDVIRLVHGITSVNLHSHKVVPPMATLAKMEGKEFLEVSGYGNHIRRLGDINDHWEVDVVYQNGMSIDKAEDKRVKVFSSVFALRHKTTGCRLALTEEILPAWGHNQFEIACAMEYERDDPYTLWAVNWQEHQQLPPTSQAEHKAPFLKNFVYLNKMMWETNNNLLPNPDRIDMIASKPTDWPFMGVALRLVSWDDESIKYFLIGNPLVWWPCIASVIAFAGLAVFYNVREQRQSYTRTQDHWNSRLQVGKVLFYGWFIHYFPFFIMGRVTYLHHYFPSLYFSILLLPFMLDHMLCLAPLPRRKVVFGVVLAAVVLTFMYFSPFAYGVRGPISNYLGRQWRKGWNVARKY